LFDFFKKLTSNEKSNEKVEPIPTSSPNPSNPVSSRTGSLDAFTSIPFAILRNQNKSIKYATYKLINIFINLFFNILFFII
jgi:hypothetical protein